MATIRSFLGKSLGQFLAALTIAALAPSAQAQSQTDAELALAAADAVARGCDLLDTSSCLYPFPSNHYTVTVGDGESARTQNIYTGRRVNFSTLATPRNAAGKPIDPTEWNRNDGFSPGTMIFTYLPGLDRAGLLRSFGFTPVGDSNQDNRVGITNPAITTSADAPIQVINTRTGERHPVWAEMDVNADTILPEVEFFPGAQRPQPGRSALILRPARNFTPGDRYVVVLQQLVDADGNAIAPTPAFQACRDGAAIPNPVVTARCDALEASVFPAIEGAGIARADTILAWDFTVASAQNMTARLTHMRDDAFSALARPDGSNADCTKYDYAAEPADLSQITDGYINDCAAPQFTVDTIREREDGDIIQIEGTLTLPSYVVPADPSPAEAAEIQALIDQLEASPLGPAVANFPFFETQSLNVLPPHRLNYNPADNTAPPADPNAISLLPYGDGLPDRTAGVGEMTTRYLCQVKSSIVRGEEDPARATLYGHGLLQSRAAVDYDEGKRMVERNNFMMCGLDWYGFSQNDLHNVAISLLDMSHWPVIPDASLQGFLNWMFFARAMQHPAGLAAHPAFQIQIDGAASGVPFFDRQEIFYYGNSQGGILPGPVVAVSKDINTGVFGVPGMNYSTLLRRSTDFTLYSVPLYLSYQDELDRNIVFAMVQMLWDRGENNGYAAYLTDEGEAVHGGLPGNANLDGQDNDVLLHPAFSDHQVSYWTADVMARTMGAVSDRDMLLDSPFCLGDPAKCDPDVEPMFGYDAPAYDANGIAPRGPAEVVWVRPEVAAPPIVELPPSSADHGPDPHGYPRTHATSLCQMTQFLRIDGILADVQPLWLRADGSDRKNDNSAVLDECAQQFGTPITVAKTGAGIVPLDSDGDGVADVFDQCPDTAAGADVDDDGCTVASDEDGDGVNDADDLCPNTPAGAAVDGNGCADSQKDSDGDGVSDDLDQCPATPAGTAVGSDGCEQPASALTVSLSADPTSGDITDGPLTVSFTANAENTDPQGGVISYVYYYGDGTNSGIVSQTSISHDYDKAGNYQASVVVVDENNNSARDTVAITTTTTVTVDPDPIVVEAVLSVQLSGNTTPVTAMFDASGSTAPEGAIYRFDFGNGDVQEGSNQLATRTYALAGSYTVTLTVTDANDANNSDTTTAIVTVGSGQQTTVQLVVTPTTANIGQTVTFDASASIAAEGTQIVSFEFDFDDGTVETRTVAEFGDQAGIATHAYSAANTYQPTVTVTDSSQAQQRASLKVKVNPAQPPVTDSPAQSGGGALGTLLLLPLLIAGLRRRRLRA